MKTHLRRIVFALALTVVAVPSFAAGICGYCDLDTDTCVPQGGLSTKCFRFQHPCSEWFDPVCNSAVPTEKPTAAAQWEVASVEVDTDQEKAND